MATKKVTRKVSHSRYYGKVDGKMALIPVGTEVSVTEEDAEKKKGKLVDPKEQMSVVDGKLVTGGADSPEGVQAALTAMQKQVDEANAKTDKLDKENKALKAAAKKTAAK